MEILNFDCKMLNNAKLTAACKNLAAQGLMPFHYLILTSFASLGLTEETFLVT